MWKIGKGNGWILKTDSCVRSNSPSLAENIIAENADDAVERNAQEMKEPFQEQAKNDIEYETYAT